MLARFKINPTLNLPEESLQLRWLVFISQFIAFTALTSITQLWIVFAIALSLNAAGLVWSYRTRHKPRRWAKILMAIVLHLLFCGLVIGVVRGFSYPQVQFAMLATALVSFEVFSRLNMYSALGLGIVNLYVCATISRDITFGMFLLIYFVLFMVFLWLADNEDGIKRNKFVIESTQAPARTSAVWLVRMLVVGCVIFPLIFVLTPRFASRPLFMPITIRVPIESNPSRQIINPAVPLVQLQGTVQTGQSEYYFGFADSLDLGYRGGLTDTIMMYVSSPAWSYWRGFAYDYYDGRIWQQSNNELQEIEARSRANFLIEKPKGTTYVQSFYIVQEMPNVLWAGTEVSEVFFPSEKIALDMSGGIRLGAPLEDGLIYSVISSRTDIDPQVIRDTPTPSDLPDEFDIYLQLPETITQRTRDLAEEVTQNATNDYDRAIAIRDYLLQIPYDFFPPPQIDDVDSVDQFLFIDKRGVCEHYASAMVVMLRTLGIPARFVVGYGSGDYNALSGFYEVRANDAHAWVEVYYHNIGRWLPLDPTPGWVADPFTGPVQTWAFSNLLGFDLPQVSLGQLVRGSISIIGQILPIAFWVMVVAGVGYALWWFRQRYTRWLITRPKIYHQSSWRKAVFREYHRRLRALGIRRGDSETVREQAKKHPTLQDILNKVEEAGYKDKEE
jgi:protein-glutamine gamma-glutamyltransferase